jgi:hypothetical protein
MTEIPRLLRATVVAVAIAAAAGAPAASADDIEVRRDGSKAVDVPAPVPTPTSPALTDGFDLDDAGVGAAVMLATVLGLAGVASRRVRRRPMGAS